MSGGKSFEHVGAVSFFGPYASGRNALSLSLSLSLSPVDTSIAAALTDDTPPQNGQQVPASNRGPAGHIS